MADGAGSEGQVVCGRVRRSPFVDAVFVDRLMAHAQASNKPLSPRQIWRYCVGAEALGAAQKRTMPSSPADAIFCPSGLKPTAN